ncbi:hypothetical protein PX699_12100 [Sphingobium sp. H39-3-25]|nr:hypothetical protein [Sphingobium arseniciresistens]
MAAHPCLPVRALSMIDSVAGFAVDTQMRRRSAQKAGARATIR